MLLVFAFAVLALGRAEVDIITSPAGPGNQYVRLQTGHHRDVRNLSETQVHIKDEGLTGVQHKYPIKKAETVSEKKDFVGVKATVNDEGASGLIKKQSGNGVPALKHLPYEVLSGKKEDDGGLDFDDDFHPLNKKKLVPAGTSQASRVNVKKGPNGQDYEYEYVYYYYDDDEEEPTTAKNKDAAVHESRTRQEVVEEEPKRRNEAPRNRYTTIERGRATVTTTEQTNELVPRGGQRTRGRQFETQSIPQEEERLPANTRFPSRGRNGQTHTTQTPQTEIPTRSRTTSGNVRRPSLVDSSSFRTHSSDVAPDAAQEQYYTNHRNSAEVPPNTRESDLEEYVDTVRPTTFSPPSTTTIRFNPLPPVPEEEDSMPDKAAHDLYAILQQTQEENYVSPGEVEEATTEILTTPTTTTTTTTTTEATTTTTTTTTAAPGRSRFRGVNGARARPRPSTFSTTQSTEPKEVTEEVKKSKFQPQRNRATSYRRSTTQAPQEESTTQKRSFGGSNRYRSRGKQEEEVKDESTTQAATSRPTRPRLNISGARPLRPGPKINLRRTSTQAPVSEEPVTQAAPQEEPIETTPATSPSPPPTPQDALSRLRNRPRLRVGARPHPAETSTTTTQATEASETPEETPSSTAEPAKPSPLLRRRPNIRRLTLPHSQPQQQQQQ